MRSEKKAGPRMIVASTFLIRVVLLVECRALVAERVLVPFAFAQDSARDQSTSEPTRGFKNSSRSVAVLFFPKMSAGIPTSSLLMMEVADSDRASSNSFRKRSFSSSALRHLSSRSERYFAFLSRYALWTMREREGGSVVSFRLPLAICEPRCFVWIVPNRQIRRQIANPNLNTGSATGVCSRLSRSHRIIQ